MAKANKSALWLAATVIGVGGTAILSANGGIKASKIISANPGMTPTEKVKATWKCYIPAVGAGLCTIGSVFCATASSRHKALAMASAYNALSKFHDEYVKAVKDKCGVKAHNDIMESIMVEKTDPNVHIEAITAASVLTQDIQTSDVDEVTRTFYDVMSERYFESTMSQVLQAEYHLNRNYTILGAATLNMFYSFLGLTPVDNGDDLGWSSFITDGIAWIDFDHRVCHLDDGMEVIQIEPEYLPEIEEEEDD